MSSAAVNQWVAEEFYTLYCPEPTNFQWVLVVLEQWLKRGCKSGLLVVCLVWVANSVARLYQILKVRHQKDVVLIHDVLSTHSEQSWHKIALVVCIVM